MFCRECVQENLKVRSRKCPACGKGFGQDDVHDIYLT
jgi:E3 ubiquitin-protein ligase BRE1